MFTCEVRTPCAQLGVTVGLSEIDRFSRRKLDSGGADLAHATEWRLRPKTGFAKPGEGQWERLPSSHVLELEATASCSSPCCHLRPDAPRTGAFCSMLGLAIGSNFSSLP